MQDALKSAFQSHQAGELSRAASLYQGILVEEPENAEATHLLGLVYHQQGDHARAVELMTRSVAMSPSAPGYHANLAEAYRALGRHDRAIGCCRAALALRPDYPEAIGNLGLSLQAMGRKAEALAQFRRVLELRPDFAPGHNNLANLLRELGQREESLAHCRRAVELDPAYAPALTNLGQMLLEHKLPREALPYSEQAVHLQPRSAAMRHNLGNVYRDLGRYVDARGAYLEAIGLEPALAKAHAQLGVTLIRENEPREALPWLRKAAELDPTDESILESLGELLLELDEYAESARVLKQALEHSSSERMTTHLSLGWALQEEGRPEEAIVHFQKANALDPTSAMARNYLGGYYEEQGLLDLAESAYRSAIALQPSFALPYARLGTLLRGKLPDADKAALERWLEEKSLNPEARGRVLFSLAHVLDARGEFAGAAALLGEANALTRDQRRSGRDHDPDEHARFVDNAISVFNADFLRRTHDLGPPTRQPVFIFGLPRSGTTLIESVLSSHPRVHGAGELRITRTTFEDLPEMLGLGIPPFACVSLLDHNAIQAVARLHLDRMLELVPRGFDRVTDKMPDNYLFLGLLATLFPRATFIHCRRDLRDVAVSCWITDFRGMDWASDQAAIAGRFGQYLRIMNHWREVLPQPILEVDYEQTVQDLEGVARRIVAACGLEWSSDCLEFHRAERSVRTASLTQVRQPVYTRSVGRWQHYEPYLADLLAALPRPTEEPSS